MSLARLISLPLLTKELVERAARRRTYWLRVLFGLALYIIFWSENRNRFRAANQPLALVGIGCGERAPTDRPSIAITNVTVIDVTAADPARARQPGRTVLIEGSRASRP